MTDIKMFLAEVAGSEEVAKEAIKMLEKVLGRELSETEQEIASAGCFAGWTTRGKFERWAKAQEN